MGWLPKPRKSLVPSLPGSRRNTQDPFLESASLADDSSFTEGDDEVSSRPTVASSRGTTASTRKKSSKKGGSKKGGSKGFGLSKISLSRWGAELDGEEEEDLEGSKHSTQHDSHPDEDGNGSEHEDSTMTSSTAKSPVSQPPSTPGGRSKHSKHSRRSRRRRHEDSLAQVQDVTDDFVGRLLNKGLLANEERFAMMFSERKLAPRVYKEGNLEKQGNFFKTWHTRYFVLTTRGLSYYTSKRKFKDFEQPLGVIPFRDVQYEGGRVVNDLPDNMARVLRVGRHTNLFCMYLESRTLLMSASSANEKESWIMAIGQAYERHLSKTFNARKQLKLQEKKRAPVERAASEAVSGPIASLDIDVEDARAEWAQALFEECAEEGEMMEIFEVTMERLRHAAMLRRTFAAWRCYADFRKRINASSIPTAPLRAFGRYANVK